MKRFSTKLFAPVAGMSFLMCAPEPSLAEWQIKATRLDSAPTEIVLREKGRGLRRIRVKSDGVWMALSVCGEKLCALPSRRGLKKIKALRDELPDGRSSRGKFDIERAWLSKPTRRYSHGILGDGVEAGALSVMDRRGSTHELSLPMGEVFEDRYARVLDIDGDKSDEVAVVLSSKKSGSSLALFKLTGSGLAKVAQTKPVGRRGSWVNPAGFGDFDGDGVTEVALVINPDHGGELEFWEYKAGQFRLEMSLRGFSTHARGSRVLNMSAVADFDKDGKPDVVLPGARRDNLRIISFANGMVGEPANIKLPGRIVTEVISIKHNKRPAIVAGLDSGIVVLISNVSKQKDDDDLPSWYKKANETSLFKDMIERNQRRIEAGKTRQKKAFGRHYE